MSRYALKPLTRRSRPEETDLDKEPVFFLEVFIIMMKFLSWGCGVQSTALGEMSASGELEPLDAVITADTGWERQKTYEAREFYADRWRRMGMRVEIVSGGDIRQDGAINKIHIPFFTSDGGQLRRQCTKYFKLIPVKRRIRQIMGYHVSKHPHPKPGSAEVWLGISLDEWRRAKRSRVNFMTNRWPLLEKRMDRDMCMEYLRSKRLPIPIKSACLCCPYRAASEWLEMSQDTPNEFESVIELDELIRDHKLAKRSDETDDRLFVYKHREPLATADLKFDAKKERQYYGTQLPMFCESGWCGT